MRKVASLALIMSLVFLACEKQEDPKEEKNPPDIPLTELIIGPSGGKLKTPSFEMIVPAGAFPADHTIKLTEGEEESSFGELSISGQYLIEGLPDELNKPLKIKIKYAGSLTDQSFIAAGEDAMDAATGAQDVFYEFIEGNDSSGFLVVTYPGDGMFTENTMATTHKSAPDKKWIKLEVVSNFISKTYNWGGKHTYDMYLRKDLNSLHPELIQYFDRSYQTYLSRLKFKYDFYVNVPLYRPYKLNRILVTNVKEDIYCKYLWKMKHSTRPGGIFVINAKKLNDAVGMQRAIAREVFRSILFQNDEAYPEMNSPGDMKYYWLNQALITWSEEYFVPLGELDNFVPSDFPGNELAPLKGLDHGSYTGPGSESSKAIDYGRGLSSLISFVSIYDGNPVHDTLWAHLYKEYAILGVPPATFMIAMMNSAYNSTKLFTVDFENNTRKFWLSFLHVYLSGDIYSVESNTFLNSITVDDTYIISTKDDTLKSFTRPFPELSAGLFRVDIQNEEIQRDYRLEISLTGANNENGHALLYGYKNGKFTLLDSDRPYAIPDLSAYETYLIAVGYDYFTVTHDTYTNLELQVRCKERKSPKFTRCSVMAQLRRIAETDNAADPENPNVDTVNWTARWYLQGNFTGNTFDATLDTVKHDWDNISGGGEIILDDNNNLVSMHVLFKSEQVGVYRNYFGIDCKNMPAKYDEKTYLLYEGKKSETCDYVELLTFHSDNESNNYRTKGFLCDDNSHIIIRFSNE